VGIAQDEKVKLSKELRENNWTLNVDLGKRAALNQKKGNRNGKLGMNWEQRGR